MPFQLSTPSQIFNFSWAKHGCCRFLFLLRARRFSWWHLLSFLLGVTGFSPLFGSSPKIHFRPPPFDAASRFLLIIVPQSSCVWIWATGLNPSSHFRSPVYTSLSLCGQSGQRSPPLVSHLANYFSSLSFIFVLRPNLTHSLTLAVHLVSPSFQNPMFGRPPMSL